MLAHPDDAEFGAGGTIARLAANGSHVVVVVVTDGSQGTDDPDATGDALFNRRQAEQHNAAEILGIAEVHFLGFPDGRIYNNETLREALVRQIRRHRPDLLITHDPTTRIWDEIGMINHPDHRAVGDTTLDAVYPLARDRLSFPQHEAEGLAPHKVLELFLTGSNQPNFAVDISETLEAKIDSIVAHVSQIAEPEQLRTMMTERAKETGERWGMDAAEQFRRLTLWR